MKSKSSYTITLKELLQIAAFVLICFYLATCNSIYLTTGDSSIPNTNTPGTSTTASGETKLRKDIVQFAKKHVGTKYKTAGRTPSGFDCSGFTCYVMDKFDIDLSPVSRMQENEGKVISLSSARPGDLLFFRRGKNEKVFHVALVVDNGRGGVSMVHSTSSRGVVVDNLKESSYWRTKYVTARDVINR